MKKKTIAIAIASTVVSGTLITLPNVFANDMTSINQESQVMDEALESIRIQTFNYLSADELVNYDDVYKVPMENIKSITNNGGQYASSKITLAIDGDKSTHWETGKPNTDTFKNHFIVEFEEIEMINRLVYTVRQSGATGKGFPLQFEIYTSLTEDGDDFTLVGSAQTAQNNNAIEIKFQPTEFKRLKFVFVEAHNSWASAAELAFYSEDVLSDVINNVFVDGTHTQLAEEYQSLEKINEIEQLLVGHPLKDRYQKVIENARAIYENPDVFKNDLMITASQRGDASVEAREHQIPRTSYSLDSFGRYITPGETIEVYVDADEDGIYPKLVMGQIADDKNGWIRTYDLKPGYNQITAQEFDEMSPAILYVYNPALESQQAYAPIVRLVGGTDFPIYRHGETTPEEYEAALLAYMEKVSFDDEDFANGVRDDVYYNVTELVSENNTISTTAAGAIAAINEMNKTGYSVYDTMEQKEYVWQEVQRISGFDDEDENPSHHIFNQKFTTRVFTKGAFGWSASGYVGFNGGNTERRDTSHFKQIVLPFAPNLGWGYYHEWGHSINNSTIEHLEVTNNIYSAILHKHFGDGDRADWNYIYKRFSNEEISHGYFTYLAILLQLEYYYEDAYANASRIARENPDGVLNGLSSSLERLVVAYSIANGVDLTDFFEDWNYVSATDVMKEKVAHLPKPDVKLEYMYTTAYQYEGPNFTEDAKVNVLNITTDATNNQNTITFEIDENNTEAVMGYEIKRDGEVVGYTANQTFVDAEIDPNQNYVYEITAYDKRLNESQTTTYEVMTPNITTDEFIVLPLYKEFNVLDYLSVKDHLGTDLSDQLDIVSSNVDVNKRGTYDVVVAIENHGVRLERTLTVVVVSEVTYASDMEWISSTSGYGKIYRDRSANNKDIMLNDSLAIRTYEKGIGMHATSEVVLDIEGLGFETFESFIGVDADAATSATSINFLVYVDDELAFDSGRMTLATPRQQISIPVAGAKTVKLVMNDSGNGNSNDRGVWADTKFTSQSSNPVIEGVESTFIKLREEFNPLAGIKAFDIEDGDLTENIEVQSNMVPNKTGAYEITYTVTDSEGNQTSVTREVFVYSETTYLSDLDWKTAISGYGSITKDASGSNPLKLLVNGEVVEYSKGIKAHAVSEIVYDIENSNYEYFQTYVGVDRNLAQNNNSSIVFQFFADGEEVYNSGVMRYADEAKFVSIPVAGVKELKLVINDGGNGNGSDHGIFADSQFLIANAIPTLQIEKSLSTKVGVDIENVFGVYEAMDAEDGDLTESVVVTGEVNMNKPGNYPLVYTVSDSDGNTVTKTRTISVVDMDDSIYLSDLDWKSATIGWASVNKDLSVSSKTLRLSDEHGLLVSYEKGIGTHAKSTIIYDLTDTNYSYFTSFVGVDREMFNSAASSVVFEVYVDGVKVADSGLMTAKTPQHFFEVDILGAKELKLVLTDNNNGNASDHGNWADAKFHFANDEKGELDFTALHEILAEIETLNEADYTKTSWDALRAVLDKVSTGLNQASIDTLVSELIEAKNNLVSVANITNLQALVTEAEALEAFIHTDNSWQELTNALDEALEVLALDKPIASQVQDAIERLETTLEQLVVRELKVNLKATIEQALALDSGIYTDLETLEPVMTSATSVYENMSATDGAIEEAMAKLNEGIIIVKSPKLVIEDAMSTKLGIVIENVFGNYSAIDPLDGDLTASVEISGDVNFDKTGQYTLTYTVTNSEGLTTSKTRVISVVDMADYTYLTDYDWKSTSNSYTAPKKDLAVSGNAIRLTDEAGGVVTYERGIGAHATSTIVYDLTDKDYAYFTSYVGVDRQMYNSVGSVSFEVYLDGVKVADTGLMTGKMPQQYLEVALGEAKELKLVVTNGGNGQGSDHASFGDAKLHFANTSAQAVDKTALNELLETVNQLDATLYTEVTYTQLMTVVENVRAELTNGYNQTEINELTTMLQDALDALVAVEVTKQLEALIEQANEFVSFIHTEASWTVMLDAKQEAEAVLQLTSAATSDYETAIQILTEAMQQLVVRETKVELNQMIEDAQALDESIYEASDVEALQAIIATATTIYEKMSASDDEVLAQIQTLTQQITVMKSPKLTIPSSSATKLGLAIEDVFGTYSASDAVDGELTEKVQVSGEVDFDKTGEYELTYSVTNSEGYTSTKTRRIAVVEMSDYNYLTDYDWKSQTSSYRAPKKDLATGGNAIRLTDEAGNIVTYERGIGAHATSTIVYDLSDKNYAYFTTYVGVDRQMYNTVASISFEVYVDGVLVADTGLITSKMPQQYLEIDIFGAKELKLVVTNGGNGQGSDHASFGDTKLHFANESGQKIDRELLDDLLARIDVLDPSHYTEESWSTMVVVKDSVMERLTAGYSQSLIDSVTSELKDAFDALECVIVYDELEETLNVAKALDLSDYTEESIAVLNDAIAQAEMILEGRTSSQADVDSAVVLLNEAMNGLELIDFTQVITIKDAQLKAAIQAELGVSGELTLQDMLNLTTLRASSKRIESLDGLQYAKNLEYLDVTLNKITDLSPLNGLAKLTEVRAESQQIIQPIVVSDDGRLKHDMLVFDIAGEQVLPYDVYITNYHVDNGDWPNIADIVNQNKNIDVDVSMLEAGKYSMHFLYEYPEADYDFWFIMTFEIE